MFDSIELNSRGMHIGGALNQNTNNSSGRLPGVTTGNSARTTDPVNTAAMTSESDIYQASCSHVLLGEAQYSQGKFNEVVETLLNSHQAYGKSQKALEILMKLGVSLAVLDNAETACATSREIPKRYPIASKFLLNKVASEQKRLRF